MAVAESDPEDRVRSFSTRVLGKLRPPESAELMRKLLADRSEYVRLNAAWAIGELSDREAAPRLRQLQKRDPSNEVRRSAEASLRRIEGG
jgi:HEAT repeat protein